MAIYTNGEYLTPLEKDGALSFEADVFLQRPGNSPAFSKALLKKSQTTTEKVGSFLSLRLLPAEAIASFYKSNFDQSSLGSATETVRNYLLSVSDEMAGDVFFDAEEEVRADDGDEMEKVFLLNYEPYLTNLSRKMAQELISNKSSIKSCLWSLEGKRSLVLSLGVKGSFLLSALKQPSSRLYAHLLKNELEQMRREAFRKDFGAVKKKARDGEPLSDGDIEILENIVGAETVSSGLKNLYPLFGSQRGTPIRPFKDSWFSGAFSAIRGIVRPQGSEKPWAYSKPLSSFDDLFPRKVEVDGVVGGWAIMDGPLSEARPLGERSVLRTIFHIAMWPLAVFFMAIYVSTTYAVKAAFVLATTLLKFIVTPLNYFFRKYF